MKLLKKFPFSFLILTLVFYCFVGCLFPAVEKHLTDELYVFAPDSVEQVAISYHYPPSSFYVLIEEMVIAVGFNDDFVIAKRQPANKKAILYYIIDVNKMKKDREKHLSNKDQAGQTEYFLPEQPKPLSIIEFNKRRKQMNIPDSLDFTLTYSNKEE